VLKLYSTDCDRCKRIESLLKEKNISFEKIMDFDHNFFIEKGFDTVPILEINDNTYLNFTEAKNYIRSR